MSNRLQDKDITLETVIRGFMNGSDQSNLILSPNWPD
jgi:hypothetical protein